MVLAPLVLVVVLVVSAVAKLRDPGWTPETVTRMGVPDAFAKPWMVKALPWGELLLAALLLLPGRWSLLGAVPTTGLMLAYVAVVVNALRTIANPTCHCFGRLTEGEVTRTTVARNVVFSLAGLLAVIDGWLGFGLVKRLLSFAGSDWAWMLGAVAVAAVVFLVLRESAPAAGAAAEAAQTAAGDEDEELLDYQRVPIPFAALTRPDGTTVRMRDLPLQGAVLLIFVSMGCGGCRMVLAELPGYLKRLSMLKIHPVTTYSAPDADNLPELDDLLFDPSAEALQLFGSSYPMAVLLGADGLLAGGPVTGAVAIGEFIDDIEAQLNEAVVLDHEDEDQADELVSLEAATTP